MSRGKASSVPPAAMSEDTMAVLEKAVLDHPEEPLSDLLRIAIDAYKTENRARLHAVANLAQVETLGRKLYQELEAERAMCDVYRSVVARKAAADEHSGQAARGPQEGDSKNRTLPRLRSYQLVRSSLYERRRHRESPRCPRFDRVGGLALPRSRSREAHLVRGLHGGDRRFYGAVQGAPRALALKEKLDETARDKYKPSLLSRFLAGHGTLSAACPSEHGPSGREDSPSRCPCLPGLRHAAKPHDDR